MKRSQKKFLNELQIKMNSFILELATITKMLQLCSDPNCPTGCKLEKVDACSDPNCPTGCVLEPSKLCSDPNCPTGCKLDEVNACSDPNCPTGCKLEKVDACNDPNCPTGCKLDETEISLKDCGCGDPNCDCGDDCDCENAFGGDDGDDENDEEKCKCGCNHGKKKDGEHKHKHNHNHCECGCEEDNCDCDETCECGCQDGEECTCGCDCDDEECDDDCDCGCHGKKKIDYKNLAMQIQADFDNYRRRNNDAILNARNDGTKNAVVEFLPILDTINKAISIVNDADAKHGLELIKNSFVQTLEKIGVTPINALNEHYDPNFHNVVLSEESDKESGIIIEELEKGYTYKGAVIKHSIVKIAK